MFKLPRDMSVHILNFNVHVKTIIFVSSGTTFCQTGSKKNITCFNNNFRDEKDVTLLVFFFQLCIKIELKHILTLLIRLKTIVFCQVVVIISWGLKRTSLKTSIC